MLNSANEVKFIIVLSHIPMNNQAYFSNIRSVIISMLRKSESEVSVAMAWFTNRELLNELILCLQRGVKVSLILLDDIINHCDFGADFNLFIAENNSEFYLYPQTMKFMHHKFCIIDNRVLITGSYNWTNYAESRNLENIIITEDYSLIEEYIACFNEMKQNLESVNTFDIISQDMIPTNEFYCRMTDIAHEVYAFSEPEQKKFRNDFEGKVSKLETPESIKAQIPLSNQQEPVVKEDRNTTTITKVENFKYPVSHYNIGFKANLIDLGGKQGLKVMISKGQALPYTVTCEAKSANSGDFDSMESSCEFYYGETNEISRCTKLGDALTLKNLPKLKEGEAKFKIVMTLDENCKLSIKFVCTNTGNGIEGKHINDTFVEYLRS